MADALSIIFKHEGIQYSHGIGPGCIAIEVLKKDEKRAKNALAEWKRAVDAIYNQMQTR